MDVLGIPQSQSSTAMSVVGCCEVVSRLLTSYVGDYFKGKILYLYAVCAFILCLQNALGSLAYTFTQLTIYGAGMLTLICAFVERLDLPLRQMESFRILCRLKDRIVMSRLIIEIGIGFCCHTYVMPMFSDPRISNMAIILTYCVSVILFS